MRINNPIDTIIVGWALQLSIIFFAPFRIVSMPSTNSLNLGSEFRVKLILILAFFNFELSHLLIAATFCMFNRYVDGLDTWAPQDREFYVKSAKERAEEGYAHYDPYK
jgi:uncharacterized membrane protein YpjA